MDKPKPNRKTPRAHRPIAKKSRARQQHLSLDKYLQDSHTLAPRLQRLAQDIATISLTPKKSRFTCAECEQLIEFYVDAEKRGEQVRTGFPVVWKHLKTCDRCRTSYELLTEALNESALTNFDAFPASPPPLPFLAPPSSNTPWTRHAHARVAGAPLNFGFTIRALYLRQSLSTNQPTLVMRGEPGPAKRALVLSDTISLGNRDVIVKIWIQRLETSPFARLEISLAASVPLPDPLRVNLTSDGYTYSNIIQKGHFSFDEFPVSVLEDARDLRVEFEADDDSAVAIAGHAGRDVG